MATLQKHPHVLTTNHHSNDSLEQPFYSTTTTHNRRTRRLVLVISKINNDEAWKEKKLSFLDYDKGIHKVSVELSGLRKSDIPMHHRLRVQGDRFHKDWTITQVVHKVLELYHWDEIQGLLNRWLGRFARNNFSLLIRATRLEENNGFDKNDGTFIPYYFSWTSESVSAFYWKI